MNKSVLRGLPVALAAQRLAFLVALAFPAVSVNLINGQNGFLTASLLGGGLVALERQPILAGILFGLLAYKPQFGLMIPIAMIAGAQWRVIAAAAVTVILLVVVTLILFGPDTWQAFFASNSVTRVVLLEMGAVGWSKSQSVFACVRMWGGGIPLAYVAQGTVSLSVAAVIARIWRNDAPYAIKAAALTVGTLLVAPWIFDYDLIALAPAIAFLASHGLQRGFGPYEKTALVFFWFVPLFARDVAQATAVPLGMIAMVAMFILVLRRSEDSA
jgi:alpha-1,2-mannosyltransferase